VDEEVLSGNSHFARFHTDHAGGAAPIWIGGLARLCFFPHYTKEDAPAFAGAKLGAADLDLADPITRSSEPEARALPVRALSSSWLVRTCPQAG
jgi:hypothetical protein